MSIENVIKKAIEGGYKRVKKLNINLVPEFLGRQIKEVHGLEEYILLDPLFWSSLGKAMGWKTVSELREGVGEIAYSLDVHFSDSGNSKFLDEWEWKWHSFIQHLAEGGTITGFFEQLK